jgi:hypothetical protein
MPGVFLWEILAKRGIVTYLKCDKKAIPWPHKGQICIGKRKMTDSDTLKIYTLYMPKEERVFFRHFHIIAMVFFLVLVCLGMAVSSHTAEDAVFFALVVVIPMYLMRLIYGKRFVESVTLDFQTGKARFVFSDERGVVSKDFSEIREIKFRFYLTFDLDDMRYMVKRPKNKKEVFQILQRVAKVDMGLFKGI